MLHFIYVPLIFKIYFIIVAIDSIVLFITDYAVREEMGLLKNLNVGPFERYNYYKKRKSEDEFLLLKKTFIINIWASIIFYFIGFVMIISGFVFVYLYN